MRDLYPLYSELEFKTLLAKLQPRRRSSALRKRRRNSSGDVPQLRAAVDPPEFARLAGDAARARRSERVAFALLGDALGVSAARRRGLGVRARRARRTTACATRCAALFASAAASRRVRREARDARAARGAASLGARFADDAMIAAHLLDPARGFADVEDARRAFSTRRPAGRCRRARRRDAAPDRRARARELEARDQLRLYEDVEVPLAPILAKMEVGRRRDRSARTRVDRHGSRRDRGALCSGRSTIFAGEEFNIGSPQQLGNVLFGKLGDSRQ